MARSRLVSEEIPFKFLWIEVRYFLVLFVLIAAPASAQDASGPKRSKDFPPQPDRLLPPTREGVDGRGGESFQGPWPMSKSSSGGVAAYVFSQNIVYSKGSLLKQTGTSHKVTYYARANEVHKDSFVHRSKMPDSCDTFFKGAVLCSRLAREDLFLDQKGALRGYRYQDPVTNEVLMVFVWGDRAAIFEGPEVFGWSDTQLADWLMGGLSGAHPPSRQTPAYWVDWGPKAIVGAELAAKILENWSQVPEAPKDGLVFDLFVPFKKGFFAFEAQRLSRQGARLEVRVSAARLLIKPFAPEIYFSLQCPTSKDSQCIKAPEVVGYQGPSPIEIDGSRYPTVKIDLRPKPMDREQKAQAEVATPKI